LNAIATLEPRKPTRLRDLMWKPARLAVKGGQDGEIYLPALYHGTHHSADDLLRLGRLTDWVGLPVRGMGLKCFLVGEKSVPIAELQPMTFAS